VRNVDASTKERSALHYAVVTPVHNEDQNLGRLGLAIAGQTVLPDRWVIVDTGSTDTTLVVARELADSHPWITVTELGLGATSVRGAQIVRAFHAGLALVPGPSDIVVKLDADISFEPDHFERLLAAFQADPALGIASGVAHERDGGGRWRARHGTGPGVWGAARAYRRTCLDELLPLEERMGWDTIDLISARVRGFGTKVLDDLPFLHHRAEGIRDRSRFARWADQGRAAHYLGYRPSYLALRTVFRAVTDPTAVGIAVGFAQAAAGGEPRYADARVIEFVRREQSLARLPRRVREALRSRGSLERLSSPS
jgi:biofilm PGA synthesis N-glycosyltransferase PgaC